MSQLIGEKFENGPAYGARGEEEFNLNKKKGL
jgi:hypothetical protein